MSIIGKGDETLTSEGKASKNAPTGAQAIAKKSDKNIRETKISISCTYNHLNFKCLQGYVYGHEK